MEARTGLLLAAVLLAGLLLRLWALQGRWINPDEGAHLLSGRLAMEGLVPGLDWASRQVIYVYIVGGFQELFGFGLLQGRLLAILATLGAGFFVFLIGRRLFDDDVAILATALFLLLPFSVLLTVHAKTQPQSILFAAAGVYFLLRGVDDEAPSSWALLLCGLALGVGYYVRQSSLAVVPVVVVLLAARYAADLPRLLRSLAVFGAGFLAVSAAVFAYYLTATDPGRAWTLSANPLAWAVEQLVRIPRLLGLGTDGVEPMALPVGEATADPAAGAGPANAAGRELGREGQPLGVAGRNALEAVRLNLFAVLGGVVSMAYAAARLRRGAEARWRAIRSYGTPLLWAGFLGAAYAFWTLRTSFFQAYFVELLPPLCILTAAVTRDALIRLRGPGGLVRDGVILAGVLLVLWLTHVLAGTPQLNRPLYFAFGALLLGVAYLARPEDRVRWLVTAVGVAVLSWGVIALAAALPPPGDLVVYGTFAAALYAAVLWAADWPRALAGSRAAGFVGYSMVASAFALTLFASAAELDRSYDGVWEPETVEAVSAILRREAEPDDRVLSGGVVWEYEAGLHSFRNETHPLRYLWTMSDANAAVIRGGLEEDPPRFIILDGFTQRTYLRHLPEIESLVGEEYELLGEFGESFFQVRVFGRTPDPGTRGRS